MIVAIVVIVVIVAIVVIVVVGACCCCFHIPGLCTDFAVALSPLDFIQLALLIGEVELGAEPATNEWFEAIGRQGEEGTERGEQGGEFFGERRGDIGRDGDRENGDNWRGDEGGDGVGLRNFFELSKKNK